MAWKLAQAYRTTPAALLGITDELAGFYLNRAVWAFGTSLEAAIETAANKHKSKARASMAVGMVLKRWLG